MIVLLLAAVVAAIPSCTEQQTNDVREVVQQYLDDEVARDYPKQGALYDMKSSLALPPVMETIPSPFEPRHLISYTIRQIMIRGATAEAQTDMVFRTEWPGGPASSDEHRTVVVYLVHEQDGWKVDELTTRMKALDMLNGAGAGQIWLARQKQRWPGR